MKLTTYESFRSGITPEWKLRIRDLDIEFDVEFLGLYIAVHKSEYGRHYQQVIRNGAACNESYTAPCKQGRPAQKFRATAQHPDTGEKMRFTFWHYPGYEFQLTQTLTTLTGEVVEATLIPEEFKDLPLVDPKEVHTKEVYLRLEGVEYPNKVHYKDCDKVKVGDKFFNVRRGLPCKWYSLSDDGTEVLLADNVIPYTTEQWKEETRINPEEGWHEVTYDAGETYRDHGVDYEYKLVFFFSEDPDQMYIWDTGEDNPFIKVVEVEENVKISRRTWGIRYRLFVSNEIETTVASEEHVPHAPIWGEEIEEPTPQVDEEPASEEDMQEAINKLKGFKF